MAAKLKALLGWCKRQCEGYRDLDVTNFTSSWKSGLAFCAIIHRYRPDLIDYDSLSKENVYDNNKLAFDTAERELSIAALLDPEDMVAMAVPDKLCIVTYVSQYHNYFRDKDALGGPGIKSRTGIKRQPSSQIPTSAPEAKKQTLHDKNQNAAGDLDAAGGSVTNQEKRGTYGDTCHSCHQKVFLMERHIDGSKLYHRKCLREKQRAQAPSSPTKSVEGGRPGSRSSGRPSSLHSDPQFSARVYPSGPKSSGPYSTPSGGNQHNSTPSGGGQHNNASASSASLLKLINGGPAPYSRTAQDSSGPAPYSRTPQNSSGPASTGSVPERVLNVEPATSRWGNPAGVNRYETAASKKGDISNRSTPGSSNSRLGAPGYSATNKVPGLNRPGSDWRDGAAKPSVSKQNKENKNSALSSNTNALFPASSSGASRTQTAAPAVPVTRTVVGVYVQPRDGSASVDSSSSYLRSDTGYSRPGGADLPNEGTPVAKSSREGGGVFSGLLKSLSAIRQNHPGDTDTATASPGSTARASHDDAQHKPTLKPQHGDELPNASRHPPRPILKASEDVAQSRSASSPPRSILRHSDTSPTEPQTHCGNTAVVIPAVKSILKSKDSLDSDPDDPMDSAQGRSSRPRPILKHGHGESGERSSPRMSAMSPTRSILKHSGDAHESGPVSLHAGGVSERTVTSPARSILKTGPETQPPRAALIVGSPPKSILKRTHDETSGESGGISGESHVTTSKLNKWDIPPTRVTSADAKSGAKPESEELRNKPSVASRFSTSVSANNQTKGFGVDYNRISTPRTVSQAGGGVQDVSRSSGASPAFDVRPKSPKASSNTAQTASKPGSRVGDRPSSGLKGPGYGLSSEPPKPVSSATQPTSSATSRRLPATPDVAVNNFSAFNLKDSLAIGKDNDTKDKRKPTAAQQPKSTWQIEMEARQGIRQQEAKVSALDRRYGSPVKEDPAATSSVGKGLSGAKDKNSAVETSSEEGKTEWQKEAERRSAARAGKYVDPEFRKVGDAQKPSSPTKPVQPSTPERDARVGTDVGPKTPQRPPRAKDTRERQGLSPKEQQHGRTTPTTSPPSSPSRPPPRPPAPQSHLAAGRLTPGQPDHLQPDPVVRKLREAPEKAPRQIPTPDMSPEASRASARLSRNPAFRIADSSSPESSPEPYRATAETYIYGDMVKPGDVKAAPTAGEERKRILPEVTFSFRTGDFDYVLDQIDGVARSAYPDQDTVAYHVPPPKQFQSTSPTAERSSGRSSAREASWHIQRPLPRPPVTPEGVPRRQIQAEERMSTADITIQLHLLDGQLQELERQGRDLEKTIRSSPDEAMDEGDSMIQWFDLVNRKNELVRRESELMYRQRQQELEDVHADLEYELRCLMDMPDNEKTVSDRVREETLLHELLDTVSQRNYIVDSMEEDRIRYIAEDQEIAEMMEKAGFKNEESEPKKKTKKKKKDRKSKEKAGEDRGGDVAENGGDEGGAKGIRGKFFKISAGTSGC